MLLFYVVLVQTSFSDLQSGVAELVVHQLAFPEIQVQTPPGANQYKQSLLIVSLIVVYVMYYRHLTLNGVQSLFSGKNLGKSRYKYETTQESSVVCQLVRLVKGEGSGEQENGFNST